jgi:outer membrane protein
VQGRLLSNPSSYLNVPVKSFINKPDTRQSRLRRCYQPLHDRSGLGLGELRSAVPGARQVEILRGRLARVRLGRALTPVGVAMLTETTATAARFAAPTKGEGPPTPFWRPPLAGIGMRTAYLTSATVALLLSSACGPADAFGGLILIDSPPTEGYSLSVGPGIAGFRDRRGSKDTKVVPVPGVDFYSSAGGFASTDVGLGWNFSRREDTQFGVRFWPILERSRTTSQRPDHSDTRTRIAKGVFLNYAPWQFLILQSNLLAGYATSGDRIQAEVGATAGLPLGDRGLIGVTLGTTWSNGPYMRNSFGVSQRESARDGLPVYSPGSGWSDINLQLSGEFQFAERWRVSGEVVKAHLIGGAGRSPTVASRNVGTFALTIWYRFK